MMIGIDWGGGRGGGISQIISLNTVERSVCSYGEVRLIAGGINE